MNRGLSLGAIGSGLACFIMVNSPLVNAQVLYQSLEDTYTQDFNALPATGSTFPWADNSTLPGWFAANTGSTTFNPAGVSPGSTTNGGLFSFGTANATERALGSIGSGSTNAGGFFWGIELVNNTGMTISGVTIGYTGEQWRNSAAAAQTVSFQYSLTATNVKTGTYTGYPALDFTSPITGGTAGALNGNLAANRTVIAPVTIPNLNWQPGATLWLRWNDPDHPGFDHGMSIDDFTFTAAGSLGLYDPPAGYYAPAAGLTGYELEAALHHLITPHTVLPWNGTPGQIDTWAAVKVLDEDPADPTKVRLVYADASALKSDAASTTASSGWDREHLWPPSRGVGQTGADYADLFNLRPITFSLASARSNKIYDEPVLTDPSYRSPAAPGAAADTSTDAISWKPAADERGDIARSLFYMDVRYDGNLAVDPDTTDLVLENAIADPSDMARLETLIQWSHDDPVSDAERRRNALVYTNYQHNRNPFVDHPEYVDALYANLLSSLQDSDQDGLPTNWETAHQLDPDDPSDAAADSDGDGFTNYEEYWMGSDPQNGADPAVLWVNGSSTASVQNGAPATPYKTIQGALDAASATGLTAIEVQAGTYYERPYVHGKSRVHLFSQSGAATTIIDGQGVNSSVVRLYDFDEASFVGFTVRNAVTDWYGAGVRVDSAEGTILLANNVFTNNSTTNTSASGGGGGLYLKSASGSRVVNNLITGNQARRGAGVLFAGGNVQFWNNTLVGNRALTGSTLGPGGGLSALTGVMPDVRNNILWANTGATGLEQLHGLTVASNLVQGAASTSGNLSADPLFISASSGDYHLSPTSPAIDTGVALPFTWDLDNNPRPDQATEHFDLGAYEVVQTTTGTPGDSDGNGLPDAWEQQNFGHLGVDPNGDDDGDGSSNLQEWQKGTDPHDFFNGQAPVLTVTSGNHQTGPPNGFVPAPLIVTVTNSAGAPLYNAPVTFTVTTGGGTLQKTNLTPPSNTLRLLADGSGQAQAFFKLPDATNSPSQITVTSGQGSHVATITFTAASDNGTGTTHYRDPFAPSDMVATLNADGSLEVTWTNNTDPATTDPIDIRLRQPGGTWKVVATVPAGSTSTHIPR